MVKIRWTCCWTLLGKFCSSFIIQSAAERDFVCDVLLISSHRHWLDSVYAVWSKAKEIRNHIRFLPHYYCRVSASNKNKACMKTARGEELYYIFLHRWGNRHEKLSSKTAKNFPVPCWNRKVFFLPIFHFVDAYSFPSTEKKVKSFSHWYRETKSYYRLLSKSELTLDRLNFLLFISSICAHNLFVCLSESGKLGHFDFILAAIGSFKFCWSWVAEIGWTLCVFIAAAAAEHWNWNWTKMKASSKHDAYL